LLQFSPRRQAGIRLFVILFLFCPNFVTPVNELGEPLPVVALEVGFWALIAIAEAFAVASTMEGGKAR
jgi:hypothetical protein